MQSEISDTLNATTSRRHDASSTRPSCRRQVLAVWRVNEACRGNLASNASDKWPTLSTLVLCQHLTILSSSRQLQVNWECKRLSRVYTLYAGESKSLHQRRFFVPSANRRCCCVRVQTYAHQRRRVEHLLLDNSRVTRHHDVTNVYTHEQRH